MTKSIVNQYILYALFPLNNIDIDLQQIHSQSHWRSTTSTWSSSRTAQQRIRCRIHFSEKVEATKQGRGVHNPSSYYSVHCWCILYSIATATLRGRLGLIVMTSLTIRRILRINPIRFCCRFQPPFMAYYCYQRWLCKMKRCLGLLKSCFLGVVVVSKYEAKSKIWGG